MKTLAAFGLLFGAVLVAGFLKVDGFGLIVLSAAIPWFFVLNMIPPMIWLERKGSAFIQDRTGPERAFIPGVGIRLAGFVHNFADVIKLAMKEEIIPRHVNRRMYVLAPALSMFIALITGAIVPYAHPIEFEGGTVFRLQALDINVGMLWFLAATSIGVYSVVLAGWASNSKFSQLGGLRASASMISYEVVMGLALVNAFLVFGSTNLNDMVRGQYDTFLGFLPRWGIVMMPGGFLLYLIAAFAETNRAPFDLAEAESELVAGFHTEYGAFKFALFFMAEYVAIVVQCLIIATVFLGGWQPLPWNLLNHDWLKDPSHAAAVLRVILGVTVAGGMFMAWVLLRWHGTNRLRWKDARKNEGLALAVMFGIAPAVIAALFLAVWGGGLSKNGAAVTAGVIEMASLVGKTLVLCWLFIWVRWTLPRFRYDQLMSLGWKLLLPLALLNLMVTAFVVQIGIL